MSFRKILRSNLLIPCLQTGLLMSGGDLISQTIIEKKNLQHIEWIRPVRFFGMGFFFVAPCLRTWFGFLDRNIKTVNRIGVLKKVACDQLIFAPAFLTVFLTVNGLLQKKSFDAVQRQIKRDYFDIITTNWMIWPAVQVINFSYVPLRNQVLVVQIVALFWNTYIAWKTNRG
ncbi:UNVERIFIED_CONTAM: hypothetical protein RMT77_001181 [Armadillidium vulgare]